MDERQQHRVAANESRFRASNERTRVQTDAFGAAGNSYSLMCECAVHGCESMLDVTREHYDLTRTNDAWFVLAPDHLLAGAERSVHRFAEYWIVEKTGACGDRARLLAAEPR